MKLSSKPSPSFRPVTITERIDFLLELERKSRRSLDLLRTVIPPADNDYRKCNHWVYLSSLVVCIRGKWERVRQENYFEVLSLHEDCLMRAIRYNVIRTHVALLADEENRRAARQWERLWRAILKNETYELKNFILPEN